MPKVGTFDVFKVMCERNMDIRLAPLDNVTDLKLVKAGTRVTIGCAGNVLDGIFHNKFIGGLLLADHEQYQAVKKELEAE